ncbi:hypothetical protein [Sabulibacter ruber]|uniref:hypothetical protein n=1 Tax=Sabulibacter ruber TaxID=2811901 RepID=UPI001A9660F4|nr:hypothetical protein [Sabulibacter ruber]
MATLLIAIAGTSCSSDQKFNFNSDSWKADQDGCKGERVKLKPQLEEIRLKLIGLREPTIRGLFGKPDSEELLQRSNKIYIYYITPGPKCTTAGQAGNAVKNALAIRIDALGKVREANIFAE